MKCPETVDYYMMMKERHAEVLLVFMSIVTSIFLAEFVARMLDVKPLETRLERYEFDETLGWRTRKEYATFISRRYYAHHLYYNSDGFPTSNSGIKKAASRQVPSIALIGDSFIEGYYLPYEETIAALLDRRTEKQVLNFGVSGYSPGQYLLSSRRYFDDYNITDIVVFLFAFNDIEAVNSDDYLGYAKPLISEPSYQPVNVPLERREQDGVNRGLIKTTLDKFALWSLIKPFFRFVALPDDVPIEISDKKFSEMGKALRLIGQIHVENPAPSFHVYYIPDINELKNTDIFKSNVTRFNQICDDLKLECIVPERFLENVIEDLYIPTDHHLTALGASLVVDQVHSHLVDTK